jgi:hypothetical protein
VRDSQRSKVYRAQQVINNDVRFHTLAEVGHYLDKICRSKRFAKRWPQAHAQYARWGINLAVERYLTRYAALAYGSFARNQISLRKSSYPEVLHIGGGKDEDLEFTPYAPSMTFQRGPIRQTSVVHELAHLLAAGDRHGREFCREYLKLVGSVFGKVAERRLRVSFRAWKVKFNPKRGKRVLTEAERLALRERLVQARLKRAASV